MNINIDLDISPQKVPPVVNLSQYDHTIPSIVATLWDGDLAYTIPLGASVYIVGTKKDKTGFMYECTWTGSTVTAEITEQMTVFPGLLACEFIIVDGDQRKGTQNFILAIEPAALKDDTIISETDIPIIQELAELMEQLDAAIDEAEAWAVGERGGVPVTEGDETYHNNSKFYAGQADNFATEAEGYASDAEDALAEARVVVGATTFSVNFTTGELEYTSPNYTFNIDTTTGYLMWEVVQ